MSQENQRTYCNKNRFLPKSMEEKFSKEIKNLAKTTDRTVQIEGNTRASDFEVDGESTRRAQRFPLFAPPLRDRAGETRPFFRKPFQQGPTASASNFPPSRALSTLPDVRGDLDRVTASFPADLSNQRIVRVTPDHSLPLFPRGFTLAK